jgi:PAS domain S-box-containing protein
MTERRNREAKLRQCEERYRLLFENSLDGISIVSPKGRLIDINPAGLEIIGYDKEELLGMRMQNLYVDPAERRRLWKRVAEADVVADQDVSLRRKDGKEIVCEVSIVARQTQKGRVEQWQIFIRDVTEQKKTMRALQESEEKFRALAEQAPVGIGVVQDGKLKYINPTYAAIFGHKKDELEGRSIDRVVAPIDRRRVKEMIDRRISGNEETIEYEFSGVTKEGEKRLVRVHGTSISYKGNPAVIGTVTDITDRRRLQRDLLEVQEEERRSIGRDLHDSISSQLSGAAMMAEAVRRQIDSECPSLDTNIEEVVDLIRDAGNRSWSLAQGLYPIHLDEIGLGAAIQSLTRQKGGGLDMQVSYEGPEEISGLPERIIDHLYWIVHEAVTNARKHADPSQIRIEIEESGQEVVVTIVDDGCGFEPTDHRKAGLGLRTLQYRAELIGADLSIESEPGVGTEVRCRLSRSELERGH